jgi:Phage portal protein
VAFPRSLRIVRDQTLIAQRAAQAAEGPVPHVRESGAAQLARLIDLRESYSVSRATAMQVPAFVDALKTYSHTISAFGLREYRGDDPIAARPFLNCPCRFLPYAGVMQRTVGDLLLHDRAYWRVTDRSWDGFPTSIEVMRVEDVNDLTVANAGIDPNTQPPSDPFYYLGNVIPTRDVIKFYGDGNGGWLRNGATAINIAAALEAATLMYSESPIPTVVLKNNGADLPADQVDALLEAWEDARAARSTAYLNSTIDTQTMGFSARDVQLVEGKMQSATAIARLANLDPVWVGAGVPGSSLTYSNRTDLYRLLLDTSLRPIMDLISGRLSMPDIVPRTHAVRFDTTTFLRGDPNQIADLITKLMPLNILSEEEARLVLDLPTLGVMSYTLLPMGE